MSKSKMEMKNKKNAKNKTTRIDPKRVLEEQINAKIWHYYSNIAPVGYENAIDRDGKRTIIPNSESEIIRWAFEEFATGLFNMMEVRSKCIDKGLDIPKNSFISLMKNPVYCGKIRLLNVTTLNPGAIKGYHEPIITEEVFEVVQKILRKRWNKNQKIKGNLNNKLNQKKI